jgi:hypothetical protein
VFTLAKYTPLNKMPDKVRYHFLISKFDVGRSMFDVHSLKKSVGTESRRKKKSPSAATPGDLPSPQT